MKGNKILQLMEALAILQFSQERVFHVVVLFLVVVLLELRCELLKITYMGNPPLGSYGTQFPQSEGP